MYPELLRNPQKAYIYGYPQATRTDSLRQEANMLLKQNNS